MSPGRRVPLLSCCRRPREMLPRAHGLRPLAPPPRSAPLTLTRAAAPSPRTRVGGASLAAPARPGRCRLGSGQGWARLPGAPQSRGGGRAPTAHSCVWLEAKRPGPRCMHAGAGWELARSCCTVSSQVALSPGLVLFIPCSLLRCCLSPRLLPESPARCVIVALRLPPLVLCRRAQS